MSGATKLRQVGAVGVERFHNASEVIAAECFMFGRVNAAHTSAAELQRRFHRWGSETPVSGDMLAVARVFPAYIEGRAAAAREAWQAIKK